MKTIKIITINFKKQKRQTTLQKQYELNIKGALIRKQNESNEERKQNERKQQKGT